MIKYLQGIYLNIFFLNIYPFQFVLLYNFFFFFAITKPSIFLLNTKLINALCPKSICFLNQLQGRKVIMNSLHVSHRNFNEISGLVSD